MLMQSSQAVPFVGMVRKYTPVVQLTNTDLAIIS